MKLFYSRQHKKVLYSYLSFHKNRYYIFSRKMVISAILEHHQLLIMESATIPV